MDCTACITKENPKLRFLKARNTHQNTNKNFLFYFNSYLYFCTPIVLKNAEVAQLVEHNLAKVRVAGSNLVFRSKFHQMMEFFVY